MTADAAITSALRDLASALEGIGRPAMIIGGIAAIARGVPRTTLDIDATIAADGLDLEAALGTDISGLLEVPERLSEFDALVARVQPDGPS